MIPVATAHGPVTRPPRLPTAAITIATILCGIFSAAVAATASAQSVDEDVPSRVVKYAPASLVTDRGARLVYRRIVAAATEVCPADPGSPHFVSRPVERCRAQAISRAVQKIDNPRLAAIHSRSLGNG